MTEASPENAQQNFHVDMEKKRRPTREEITKRAEEFVERMQGREHGDIHNQIVRWSWGENFEDSQHYYPGWSEEDFLFYAQEIKRLEPESEWGAALYQI